MGATAKPGAWPEDDIHARLLNVFRAILDGKSGKDVGGFLGRIQTAGIRGIDVERYDSWDAKGPWVKGLVIGRWRFTTGGIVAIDRLEDMVTYDAISSPYPRFRYCLGEVIVVVNCTFGPRAGRGFTCRPADYHGYRSFALTDGVSWVS